MKGVDEYLDSYLDGRSDPGTAVMIVGHWGSGKTHYINDYFKRRSDQRVALAEASSRKLSSRSSGGDRDHHSPSAPDASDAEHLYASFFGAENAAAVSDQFLSQLYPLLNSKVGKVLGAAAMRLSNIGLQIATAGAVSDAARQEDAQAVRGWFANPGGRVLVFDDLERSSMPVETCLSIINSYVERDGLKVIVLANQNELVKCERYTRWKEKVIGKTIQVLADPNKVLDALTAELELGPIKTALKDRRSELLSLLAACKGVNYRSVRSLVFDSQRIVSLLAPQLRASPGAVMSVLKFSLAMGGELRAGRIDAGEIVQVTSPFFRVLKGDAQDDRKVYLAQLHERLALMEALDPIIPVKELTRYWEEGALDVEASDLAVLRHPTVVGVSSQPAWMQLWDVRSLSEKSFKAAKLSLAKELEGARIVDQGELLHLVGIEVELNLFGATLFPDHVDVVSWLTSYASSIHGRLQRTVTWLDGNSSYGGFGFHRQNSDSFKRAFSLLDELVTNNEQHRLRASLPSRFEQIASGDYESIYSFTAADRGGAAPWLHLIDVDSMVKVAICDNALQLHMLNLLLRRYSEDHLGSLREEWRWARKLRDKLFVEASRMPAPFKAIAEQNVRVLSYRMRQGLREVIASVKREAGRSQRRLKN